MGQWTSSKFPFVTLSLKKSCLYTQILAQHTKPFSSMLSTATRAFLFLSATSTLPRYTATTTKTRLRGVVFDMYRAVLGDDEYRRIKAQSPSGIDNLSHIDRWLQHQQQQAYDTIADFKRQALLHLQIMPGAADLCRLRGLITRNVKSAVDIFHERFGITFSPALSREFRPYKPDPAPQLHICSLWEVQPNEVIMIGDSLKDDVSDSFPDNVIDSVHFHGL
ncbi:haloacid dehalogenase-like hydrolase domain-containing protein At2g33255 [Lotus japonicus]|uniref:haloacid dehalogenase-like hydrolase domain-containing protein At2g33255 n=1 Tax=Lotus japonicus TaxID=34305 RepID=UPI002587FCCF|nr:haloacid dehalogenase-like hydrolase domain-containing protein At2g33255 [Lotus japonicus]XP_057427347.1 haloacid dehalogenase-like hydrolase domain-containing protein At2g33255 [Lotus japonicus]XP_057427618.1 haloacid dehalogenase-like hydrolase domain-containing protein At2g33255 [Lotus japonicus]